MRQIWITKVGPPEVLQVREAADPIPGDHEVRIRVKASGINFADIMARLGLYPGAPKLPAVVGYEVSGIVDQVGKEVTGVKSGDRVIGVCNFGGYSDTVVLPELQVFPLPSQLSFAQGAAIPVNYLTVYQMLFAMAGVKAGDQVLVHSAAGGIGFAAIDLCQIAGAQMIGIASPAKHEALRNRGVKLLIDRHKDFVEEVRRLTASRGVDIVLDAVGGESWRQSYRCLRPTGRLVVFGLSSAATSKGRNLFSLIRSLFEIPWFRFNPVNLMNDNKGVMGAHLGRMWSEQATMNAWAKQILVWATEGKIHPTVDREFTFEKAAEAHHYIQDRKNIGKVVLVP